MQLIYNNYSNNIDNLLPEISNIIKSLEFKTLYLEISFCLDDDYRVFHSTINYLPYDILYEIFLYQIIFFCKRFDISYKDIRSYEINLYIK